MDDVDEGSTTHRRRWQSRPAEPEGEGEGDDQEQDLDTNQTEGQAVKVCLSETVLRGHQCNERRKADEDDVWSWRKVTFCISMLPQRFLIAHEAYCY